jgi:ribosomal-protein-alanine N-acetyltransferase
MILKKNQEEFVFQTQNLILVKLRKLDAPFILELVNSPGWLQYIGDRNVHSILDAEHYLQNGILKCYKEHGFGFWLVKDSIKNQKLGICGITKRESLDFPDIGFAFLPKFQSMGYGFEAAKGTLKHVQEHLRLEKIVAIANIENVASNRLLIKIGMRFEKVIRFPEENRQLNFYSI